MPRENRLRSMLESLVAEIPAADSSDAHLFKHLVTKIEALGEAPDAGPAAVSALTEACQVLRAVEVQITGPRADLSLKVCDALRQMIQAAAGGTAAAPPAGVDDLLDRLAAEANASSV